MCSAFLCEHLSSSVLEKEAYRNKISVAAILLTPSPALTTQLAHTHSPFCVQMRLTVNKDAVQGSSATSANVLSGFGAAEQ